MWHVEREREKGEEREQTKGGSWLTLLQLLLRLLQGRGLKRGRGLQRREGRRSWGPLGAQPPLSASKLQCTTRSSKHRNSIKAGISARQRIAP